MLEFNVEFASDQNPLVIHNIRLANPLDPYAKQLKRLNAKRKKTDEDYEEISALEWEGGLYFDDDLGPYLPVSYPQRVMLEAAKITRDGTQFKRAVVCMALDGSNRIPIDYEGPRNIEGLITDDEHRDMRMVKIGMSRVLRTRPRFPEWSIKFIAVLDDRIINPDDFKEIAIRAGRNIGIGEAPEGSRARFETTINPREAVPA